MAGIGNLQRIKVLSKVVAGRMTMVTAAHVLDLSTRQVRRLLARMTTGGAASIRHKAIGRPSNNRIGDGVRDYSVAMVRERYADFGPTLASVSPGRNRRAAVLCSLADGTVPDTGTLVDVVACFRAAMVASDRVLYSPKVPRCLEQLSKPEAALLSKTNCCA
uniref:Putative transposase n=1 Tax=Sinorhizobium sp. M14 TaxID=430451 RepID=A0A142BPM5_9HYPH|nr:putative transposase [Sinorhizobium sp. M14]